MRPQRLDPEPAHSSPHWERKQPNTQLHESVPHLIMALIYYNAKLRNDAAGVAFNEARLCTEGSPVVLPRGAGEHGQGTGQAGTGNRNRSRKRQRGRNRAKNRGQKPVSAMKAAPHAPSSPTFPSSFPSRSPTRTPEAAAGVPGTQRGASVPQPRPPRAALTVGQQLGQGRGGERGRSGRLLLLHAGRCRRPRVTPGRRRRTMMAKESDGRGAERCGAVPPAAAGVWGTEPGSAEPSRAGQPLGAAPTSRTPAPGFCFFFPDAGRVGGDR